MVVGHVGCMTEITRKGKGNKISLRRWKDTAPPRGSSASMPGFATRSLVSLLSLSGSDSGASHGHVGPTSGPKKRSPRWHSQGEVEGLLLFLAMYLLCGCLGTTPLAFDIRLNRAMQLASRGALEASERELEPLCGRTSRTSSPQSARRSYDCHVLEARIRMATNRPEEAVGFLEAALNDAERMPGETATIARAGVHFLFGSTYRRLQDWSRAKASYEIVTELAVASLTKTSTLERMRVEAILHLSQIDSWYGNFETASSRIDSVLVWMQSKGHERSDAASPTPEHMFVPSSTAVMGSLQILMTRDDLRKELHTAEVDSLLRVHAAFGESWEARQGLHVVVAAPFVLSRNYDGAKRAARGAGEPWPESPAVMETSVRIWSKILDARRLREDGEPAAAMALLAPVSTDDPMLSLAVLTEKGAASLELGSLPEAQGMLSQAVHRWTDTLGARHPDTLQARVHLARVLKAKGDHEGAERRLEALVAEIEESFGTGSPLLQWPLEELIELKWSSQAEDASMLLAQLARIEWAMLSFKASDIHENDLFGRKRRMQRLASKLVDLHRRSSVGTDAVAELTLQAVLHAKGLAFRVLADSYRQMRLESPAPRARLAARQRTFGASVPQTNHPAHNLVSRARSALGPEDALLEYILYEHEGERRYAVCLLLSDRGMWLDLGNAARVEREVQQHLLNVTRMLDSGASGERLHRTLIGPLADALPTDGVIFVAGDGLINLVPFQALVHEGRYLAEIFTIHYLTSGYELVESQIVDRFTWPPPGRVTVLANPSGAQLPGAEAEALAIGKLFRNARNLLGSAASVAALEALSDPLILHVAAHANMQEIDESYGTLQLLSDGLASSIIHLSPLKGSRSKTSGDLTAHKLASLDLSHTELLVLSGCDTGVGVIEGGEGTLGFRLAARLAGARSQLLTLWPVSDGYASFFMQAFYTELAHGARRVDAMRRAQLVTMRNPATSHPFYWAGFTMSGEWWELSRIE